jgi:peptide/nickel transport system permease protein
VGAFLVRRLIHLVAVLAAVLVVVSILLRLIPGDPVAAMMAGNPQITEEDRDRLREQLGLNDPVPIQIWRYAKELAQGNLGESLRTHTDARPQILGKLSPTFELTIFAMLVALVIAVPLGVLTAINRDRPIDYAGSIAAVVGISVPSFVLGILMILLFAVRWRVLPTSGYGGSFSGGLKELVLHGNVDPIWRSIRYLIMPGVTLGVAVSAYNTRMIRSAMLEVLQQDYIRCARAKGLSNRLVYLRHALRNALIPVITILGLQIGYLLSGAFVIENVFAWPGIGRFAVDAINKRDYPVIQGVVMVTALLFLTINLLVDLLYSAIDPRIRVK